jgi:hypothetical protein
MKSNLFKYNFITSFIVALCFITNGFAQKTDASNYRMKFKFKTIKQKDNSRLLEVSFIGQNKKNRKDKVPVYNAEINFYNTLNEDEKLLGTSKTSKEGIAQLVLQKNQNYLTDKNGYINLKAEFKGTDAIDEEDSEIAVKDINLELNLKEIDSVKTGIITAYTIDSVGVKTPVEEADVIISVKGMLSNMKIKEGTIENGKYEFEFPTDIPGDANNNIIVYSSIEDSDDFGNVIQEKSINWGVFKKEIKKNKNTLWSKAAPLWMYIVLTILLVGVWANYMYTIISLFKISKEGKELILNSEE